MKRPTLDQVLAAVCLAGTAIALALLAVIATGSTAPEAAGCETACAPPATGRTWIHPNGPLRVTEQANQTPTN